MERSDFERIVTDVVASLPLQFQEAVKEVLIVVEERPASRSRSLLGLYEGIPLTAWGRDHSGKLPDKITLYQRNIEEHAEDPAEIPHMIRETLLHEIAHFLGYEHDKIHEMEERWRKERQEDV